jgi:hypothetical protein
MKDLTFAQDGGLYKLVIDYLQNKALWIIAWLAGWAAFNYVEFGSMWIILSMFAGIFLNLGERKEGELSAYR